jgi:hypothetical protein
MDSAPLDLIFGLLRALNYFSLEYPLHTPPI